jgi:ABC-type Mn2+/Zn2+ transport system ATPase subunit
MATAGESTSLDLVTLDSLTVPARVSAVTFSVPRATTFALCGPNGSGKSTVLDAVLGLVTFTGRCEVRTNSIAVVPQRLEVPVVLPLSVLDFLALQRTTWPVAL